MPAQGGVPSRSATIAKNLLARRSHAPSDRLKLLQYPVALAQPHTSVPLVGSSSQAVDHYSRRWLREADELCVASMRRSDSLHHMNHYIATYKHDDEQWKPLLLPEVCTVTPPSGSGLTMGSSPMEDGKEGAVDIDYNKLTSLELMSRHANYSLRHIVQRGHAMYFITVSQHSILAMRGLVEASYVSCSFGVKGERLRTHLTHVGPLDAREVLRVQRNSATGEPRYYYDLKDPSARRGVVALSLVEGYGTWFQRKPMLWQRARRIGALQAQMGAHTYDLASPESVGRRRDCEVSLLEPHIQLFGGGQGTGGGGATAVGLIASPQVAQNSRLYLSQFEAPAITAVDAVHQLAHRSALHHQLIRPAGAAADHSPMERLLPVSWTTRTPPPYVPLEADLPFKVQLSRPSVVDERMAAGTIGTPLLQGPPISMYEYVMHQGVDHYVFDDSPSARPMKWWNQRSNMPYNGMLFGVRSSMLDGITPTEYIPNPLAPSPSTSLLRTSPRESTASVGSRAASAPPRRNTQPLHEVVPPSLEAVQRAARYERYLADADAVGSRSAGSSPADDDTSSSAGAATTGSRVLSSRRRKRRVKRGRGKKAPSDLVGHATTGEREGE